jgi:hypothetical protein
MVLQASAKRRSSGEGGTSDVESSNCVAISRNARIGELRSSLQDGWSHGRQASVRRVRRAGLKPEADRLAQGAIGSRVNLRRCLRQRPHRANTSRDDCIAYVMQDEGCAIGYSRRRRRAYGCDRISLPFRCPHSSVWEGGMIQFDETCHRDDP